MAAIESHSSSVEPPQSAPAQDQPGPAEVEYDALQTLMRLVVGGALEGSDEVQRRLRQWDADAHVAGYLGARESSAEALRYALVGLLFDAEARMRARLARAGRLSRGLSGLFYRALEPVSYVLPVQPALDALEALRERGQFEVYRWIQLGRQEEQRGRGLARRATFNSIADLLKYFASDSAIRALIEQQGTEMAGTAVDEVRERTVSADAWAERVARGVLRRPARETDALPPNAGQNAGAQ